MEREDNIPIFYRIAETLKVRIDSGQYSSGGIIPSEKEIAKEFDVSLITIRKALEVLVADGLVIRKRGIGTRILPRENHRLPLKISGNFHDFNSMFSLYDKTRVLEITVTGCLERIEKTFSIPPGQEVWRMKRIRQIQGENVSYLVNYTIPRFVEKVKKRDFLKQSFCDVFQEIAGLKLLKIEQQVEAITADMDLSSVLKIKFGDPIFFVEKSFAVPRLARSILFKSIVFSFPEYKIIYDL